MDWREDATCAQVDPELFFPPIGSSSDPAKRICQACPVQFPCLAYALEHGERFGVWGGLNIADRARLVKARKLVAA